MSFIEVLKIIFLGIVEGISEWLPISSTGHMLLVNEFFQIDFSEEFQSIFFVLIQLGAIMAVVVVFWKKLFPFEKQDSGKIVVNKDTISLWFKVVVATIPAAVIGIPFDNVIEENLYGPLVIASTLIIYGVAFIVVEKMNKNKTFAVTNVHQITYKLALIIGAFQVLSLIPGTSRSGATIVGALLFGVARVAASEFTFYLAIPTMLGASLLRLLDFGFSFTTDEIIALALGCAVAFVVSIVSIKFLMNYVRNHDFSIFGKYRIVLGVLVIIYFTLIAQ